MPEITLAIDCKDSGRGAAWLARLLGVQEVPGSNPGGPTKPLSSISCRKIAAREALWALSLETHPANRLVHSIAVVRMGFEQVRMPIRRNILYDSLGVFPW